MPYVSTGNVLRSSESLVYEESEGVTGQKVRLSVAETAFFKLLKSFRCAFFIWTIKFMNVTSLLNSGGEKMAIAFKKRLLCVFLLTVIAVLISGLGTVFASEPERKYPASVENLPPIDVVHNGQIRTISLCDAFDYHGGACPGATMAFMAVRYGLELLYGQETPDPDDLVIISRAPGGPMDLLDLIMKGSDPSKRTWPPTGISRGADHFVFQFLRKSTMDTVTVKLLDGLWPEDWFDLRDKNKDGTITEAEKEKRQKDRQYVIREFPQKSYEELFGKPPVQKFIAWGHIEPGEIDKHIRDLRRQASNFSKKGVD